VNESMSSALLSAHFFTKRRVIRAFCVSGFIQLVKEVAPMKRRTRLCAK
jgi:hypothetical protein